MAAKCPKCGAEIDHLDYVTETREHGILVYEAGPMTTERSIQREIADVKIKEFTVICPECDEVLEITGDQEAEKLLKGGE